MTLITLFKLLPLIVFGFQLIRLKKYMRDVEIGFVTTQIRDRFVRISGYIEIAFLLLLVINVFI